MLKKLLFFATLIALASLLLGRGLPMTALPLDQRQIQNINQDWEYLEYNSSDLKQISQQSNWQAINLPHTWNQWDATDYLPGYRRDASWYRKEIKIPNYDQVRYLLYFEGANISTQVYVNNQMAGGHIGGYVGFEVDITEQVNKGKLNTLLIRVDNGYDPNVIPSQKSDFFIYGGITRDVWLKVVPETYIQDVQISTPQVSGSTANTLVEVSMGNPAMKKKKGQVLCELIDPISKEIVGRQEHAFDLSVTAANYMLTLPPLENPKLWSTETPTLYELRVTYRENGQTIDQHTETFGYRWFSFEKNGSFFLNGERLLLRGTHRHEEHAGYGAAMPNELHRRDMEMIKEMGGNFVRLGHYPQDPEIYRACDELGLIVWDELPWCRGGKGGEVWEKNTKRLFGEQIQQNYNHPSICFWSVGNEIYWLPDFPGGDDTTQLNSFVHELHEEAHHLDPYRQTAIRKYYAGAHLVDVFSPSIWSGWYAGVYKNYGPTLEKQRNKYPQFLHMEYGGSSHVGRHTETPITGDGLVNQDEWAEQINQANVSNIAKDGDWTENYIVDLFDWHLSISETTDWFAGNAQWAFKDFGTPLRPENAIPFLNQKGLVDRSGKPKDAYYVFKSYWAKEPFTYIESHTWTERSGPKGKSREVSVFSNCEEVELWHQGKNLGKRTRQVGTFPASGLHWAVSFAEGDNQLLAKGFKEGRIVTQDTLVVNYTFQKHGNPYQISLSAKPLSNDHYLITAAMVDQNGQRVLDYEDRVYFDLNGAGELLINYGTPTRSQVIQMANGQASIEMKRGEGRSVIEVRNQDFKGSYLVIE